MEVLLREAVPGSEQRMPPIISTSELRLGMPRGGCEG